MARSMWTGSISFGLVNIPVKMFTAARGKDIGFNQLHATDGSRIQMRRFCAEEGKEVTASEIVKGYEVGPDRYVVVTADELDALAPAVTKGIEIQEFIDLTEIDPVYFESSYYLAPDKGGAKPYALLRLAMEEAGKVALGRMVLRSKQYVVAIRPAGEALVMETLYFPDEVVSPSELDIPDATQAFDKREMAMAQQLIGALSEPFDPSKYRDEYREQLLDLIERKAAGETVTAAPAQKVAPRVVDLMAALEASIAAAKKGSADAPAQAQAPVRAAKPASAEEPAAVAASSGGRGKRAAEPEQLEAITGPASRPAPSRRRKAS
ncbi:MAG: Ku protein [Anaerolinea sp.]|nr:Ku protein [Anaerolinea sp.]